MKVCIIGHTEKNYLPYMKKYIDFFKENNIDYDIVYWDREGDLSLRAENEYCFCEKIDGSFIEKVYGYLKYRRFVYKILKKNNYDKLVVLTTMTAIILKSKLFHEFNEKYLFDFRDYSFEKFSFFRNMVNNIIDHSELTTISSHGFMDFLAPNKKIVINHNISNSFPLGTVSDLKEKSVINIGFLGAVRYYDDNVAFISAMRDTFRYQLWYIGKPVPNCDLQLYCTEHSVSNVSFAGKYDNSQKAELYKNIDIINSVYGNSSLEVTTLLPNRLYEACQLKKPIIASSGTFLGELVDRYRLGIVLDLEKDDALSIIDNYVDSFNPIEFYTHCDEFLADVQKDEESFYKRLKLFILPAIVQTKKERKEAYKAEKARLAAERSQAHKANEDEGAPEIISDITEE